MPRARFDIFRPVEGVCAHAASIAPSACHLESGCIDSMHISLDLCFETDPCAFNGIPDSILVMLSAYLFQRNTPAAAASFALKVWEVELVVQ